MFVFSIHKVEEEDMLVTELKKIESRKKEREKKQLELNKLITAAEKKPQISEHKLFHSRYLSLVIHDLLYPILFGFFLGLLDFI